MMQQALVDYTGRITLPGEYQFTGKMGTTTAECIYNGTTLAIAAFVEQVVLSAGKRQGLDYSCIITGGDAVEIMQRMQIDCRHEPLLVFEGMRLAGGN
jgi:pantothenate kinase type III